MFVALDSEEKRIYADTVEKGCPCYCPVCNKKLILKRGPKKKPHFAHKQDTDCHYGQDKDAKSEWHLRMQAYFPREACEVRFVDGENNEIHIADVYLAESNTVLEFQHSPISEQEFMSRTYFHLNNGRRIVWLFDETPVSKKSNYRNFRFNKDLSSIETPFYQWMQRSKDFLEHSPDLKQAAGTYSLCIYTGMEGETFHRIVAQQGNFEYVAFAINPIYMSTNMDIEQFFKYDIYWMKQDAEEARLQKIAQQNEYYRQHSINRGFPQLRNRHKIRL